MTALVDSSQFSSPEKLNVQAAKLPASYQEAKNALQTCDKLDECKGWSDKAQALASYAKMADDDELHKMAVRIKARAIQRCGELLKQIDGQGARTDKLSGGAPTKLTQRQAAEDAGMSKDQQVQAVRVANIPPEEFEAAIESDKPPTITQLAQQGKGELYRPKPEGYAQATQFIGALDYYKEYCLEYEPDFLANALNDFEVPEILQNLSNIRDWTNQMINRLEGQS